MNAARGSDGEQQEEGCVSGALFGACSGSDWVAG